MKKMIMKTKLQTLLQRKTTTPGFISLIHLLLLISYTSGCNPSVKNEIPDASADSQKEDAWNPDGDMGYGDQHQGDDNLTLDGDQQVDGSGEGDSTPNDGGFDDGDANDGDGQQPPVITHSYDIVVVGAGTGGFGAAIQSARLGMRVAIIEETDWVGGQATAAGVSTMDAPENWGLYLEFIDRVRQHYDDLGKSMDTCYYWNDVSQCFEPSVGRSIMEQMLSEEGIDVYYRMQLDSAKRQTVDGHPRVVSLMTKDQADGRLHDFSAALFVDATEYGDLLPLAGAKYRVGKHTSDNIDPTDCVQDITYTAIIRHYEGALPAGFAIATPPPGYGAIRDVFASIISANGTEWVDANGQPTGDINYPAGWRTFIVYRGTPDSSSAGSYTKDTPDLITKTGVNWSNDYPYTVAALESLDTRRTANCQAKLRTLQFIHYMQTELGKPDWSIAHEEGYDGEYNIEDNECPMIPTELKELEHNMPVVPYIRESRRIIGLHTLTAGEIKRVAKPGGYRSVTNFKTALCLGLHPVDLHNCLSNEDLELDLESMQDWTNAIGPFQIPFESFIPEEVDGLLPAEKNLSVSRLVNGAIRLQPSTMLSGQAVGVLAALAVIRRQQPRQVPPIQVQDKLVDLGQRLTLISYLDVPPGDPNWGDIQIAAVREIMQGDGASSFHPDDNLLRGQAAMVLAKLFSLDLSNPPAEPTFSDVPLSNPFYAAIEAIHSAGISNGCGGSPLRYCPDEYATRDQMTVMLVNALGIDPGTAPTNPLFNDVPPGHWAFAQIQIAASNNLLAGCGDDLFCPSEPMLRKHAAAMCRRTLIYQHP